MSTVEALNLAGGGVLLLLGIGVILLRPRDRLGLSFGFFSATFGLYIGLDGVTGSVPIWWPIAISGAFAVAAFGLLLVFPMRLQPGEGRFLAVAFLVGIVHMLTREMALAAAIPDYMTARLSGEAPFEVFVYRIVRVAPNVIGAASVLFLALRGGRLTRAVEAAPATLRSLGLFAAGVALFVAGNAQYIVAAAAGTLSVLAFVSVVLIFVPGPIAWTVAARGRDGRLARNAGLAVGAVFTAATVLALFNADLVFPVGRVLGALLLAYAVLRGQFEGLDLKVRFALSKSTIAAVFIAVFFIASEVAQQFFGDRTGSTYIGIGIAGTLVFAMAPIQRAAEKLAEKAVPVSSAPAGMPSRKEQTYRDALAVAMRDRKLTPAEEVTLARLAEDLGIGAGRAMEIRHETRANRARLKKRPGVQ